MLAHGLIVFKALSLKSHLTDWGITLNYQFYTERKEAEFFIRKIYPGQNNVIVKMPLLE